MKLTKEMILQNLLNLKSQVDNNFENNEKTQWFVKKTQKVIALVSKNPRFVYHAFKQNLALSWKIDFNDELCVVGRVNATFLPKK